MRRILAVLLVLLLALPAAAFARENYYGTVVCESTVTVAAPFGGAVARLQARRGMLLRAGDLLCALQTRPVLSPAAGTVTAVFGRQGETAEEIKARHGGIVYITPEHRFRLSASIKRADKNDGCYVAVGQTVWLESGRGLTLKTGTGVITSVSSDPSDPDAQGNYTAEITEGAFVFGERLTVYRTEERAPGTSLGQGTVEMAPAAVVTGEGTLFRLHAKPGDTVTPGALLFETVTGSLAEPLSDNEIRAEEDAVVLSCDLTPGAQAEQGSALAVLAPLSGLQACVTVPETELAAFAPGTPVQLGFSFDGSVREGTVAAVSYAAEERKDDSGALTWGEYKVWIDFADKQGIRTGMFVTVEIP